MTIVEKKYNWNGTPRLVKDSDLKYIVLHHAAATNCTADDIHRWHLNNGWRGIGYHYFVSKKGEVYRGRPSELSEGGHTEGYNFSSIGICAEGDFSKEVMSEAQKKALTELVADIKSRRPNLKIVRHCDLNATACPGRNYPFTEISAGKVAATTAPASKPTTPAVKRNMVKEAQHYLNIHYSSGLSEDGIWGPKTQAAVLKVLQKACGAIADGIWGPETYNKCVCVGRGDTGAAVVVIQLMGAKFKYGLEVDGIFGSATHNAVCVFQKDTGLTVDGLAGKNTFRKMFEINV